MTMEMVPLMAQHHLLEFNKLISSVAARVDECAADLKDFREALRLSDSPEAIIDEYESRGLLRRLEQNAAVH